MNFVSVGELVKWSRDGDIYIIVHGDTIHVYNTEVASLLNAIHHYPLMIDHERIMKNWCTTL